MSRFLYYYFSVYVNLIKELFLYVAQQNVSPESGCKGTTIFGNNKLLKNFFEKNIKKFEKEFFSCHAIPYYSYTSSI